MSYPKLTNLESLQNFQNQDAMIFKTKEFISKLQNLESKLDNIETVLEENNTRESKRRIRIIKGYLKILEEKYNSSETDWIKSTKNIIDLTDDCSQNEIQSLKKYLRSKKWIYCNVYKCPETLNTYWYSKAEAEIIEEINNCIDSFSMEILK